MSVIHKRYQQCKRYMNRYVMIKTKHGTYRGTIVKVDKHKVYLRTFSPSTSGNKARVSFFPIILPLVLFDLLAIVLLTKKPFPYLIKR